MHMCINRCMGYLCMYVCMYVGRYECMDGCAYGCLDACVSTTPRPDVHVTHRTPLQRRCWNMFGVCCKKMMFPL